MLFLHKKKGLSTDLTKNTINYFYTNIFVFFVFTHFCAVVCYTSCVFLLFIISSSGLCAHCCCGRLIFAPVANILTFVVLPVFEFKNKITKKINWRNKKSARCVLTFGFYCLRSFSVCQCYCSRCCCCCCHTATASAAIATKWQQHPLISATYGWHSQSFVAFETRRVVVVVKCLWEEISRLIAA